MLFVNHRLLFPSLVYQKDFIIKGPPISNEDSDKGILIENKKYSWTKKVKLYKLDWENVELKKKESHKKWNKRCWPDIDLAYINSLPEELEGEFNNYIFALDRGYTDEIRRCSQQGMLEWNISRPFDTIIREMCLDVPQSYIRVAFGLLSDCIFDEKTGYWDRGSRRESACLMLYRFWCHQTGNGLLTDNNFSGWDDEYNWCIKYGKKEVKKRVKKINGLLLVHKKKIEDVRSKIFINNNKNSQERKKDNVIK